MLVQIRRSYAGLARAGRALMAVGRVVYKLRRAPAGSPPARQEEADA